MSKHHNDTIDSAYLNPAEFVDADNPAVLDFTLEFSRPGASEIDNAISLYGAVRDQFAYTPYWDFNDPETFRASNCLKTRKGMCQSKAALLAASARALNIPARIGFADVINHMSSKKFLDILGTNIFYWHAYTDLYLAGKWVKATPAFDADLCHAFNVNPLDFDGLNDSLFQPMNADHHKFMEYVGDHGTFADVPVKQIQQDFIAKYPAYFCATPEHAGKSLIDEVESENLT